MRRPNYLITGKSVITLLSSGSDHRQQINIDSTSVFLICLNWTGDVEQQDEVFLLRQNDEHSCILMMNKMSLAVTQLDRLLVYKEMQTDLWLDQFILSVHTSTI